MAFNVYAGFVKYRRVWMAAILLLCMITFVLCTGSKGDFSDRVLGWIRKSGVKVGSVDGSDVHREEIERLKTQRNLANDFMKSYANRHLDIVSDQLKSIRDNPDQFKNLKKEELDREKGKLAQIRNLLVMRLKSKEFFPGGVQGDELLTFKAWLSEADRLGVTLRPTDVPWLVLADVYKLDMAQKFGADAQGFEIPVSREEADLQQRIINKLREDGNRMSTREQVAKALFDEYRVRMTQIAFSEFQMRSINEQVPRGAANRSRLPVSLGQIYDWQRQQRNEFDFTLLPIPVKNFTKEIAEPDAITLQKFFDDHKNRDFDPTSDMAGFKKPQQVKVQFASADPESKHFKNIAKIVNALNVFPIASPQSPMTSAMRMSAGPAIMDGWLTEVYGRHLQSNRNAQDLYEMTGPTSDDFPLSIMAWLGSDDPVAAATLVGAMFRPDAFVAGAPANWAVGAVKHPNELKAAIEFEARRRAAKYATLVGNGMLGFQTLYQYQRIQQEYAFLPLPVVRGKILEIGERRQIGEWVGANMRILKKRLEDAIVTGKQDQVERELRRYGPAKADDPTPRPFPDLGLEIAQTEKFHDRYSIADAPELKAMKEAFLAYVNIINYSEGRDNALAKRKVTEEDFWKVFFDRTETFSMGESYVAKPWPPNVTPANQIQMQMTDPELGQSVPANIQMDLMRHAENRDPKAAKPLELFHTASRPFLFWKIAEKPAAPPDSLAEVKDKVIEAWKLQKSRETKALDKAAEIARALLKGNADNHAMLGVEGKLIGAEPILLERVANLVQGYSQGHFGFNVNYSPPKIEKHQKHLFANPRDDLMTHLLSLRGLKEPIKIETDLKDKEGKKKDDAPGIAALNAINDLLLKEATQAKVDPNRFVQILTNKSRDTLYVVAIRTNRLAEPFQFQLSMRTQGDPLFEIAFDKLSETHQRDMIAQVRKLHRVEPFSDLKSVDASGD